VSTKLNREAFRKLIAENIDWLMKQPRTLEREHIKLCLEEAEKFHYDLPAMLQRVVDDDAQTVDAGEQGLSPVVMHEVCEWIEKLAGPRGG
jgi:hypothetical protein